MNASFLSHARRTAAAVLLGVIPMAAASPQTGRPAQAIPAPEQGAWPKTQLRQGQYFSYPAPVGWQANESTNGVDLGNRDGSEGVSFVGLEGTPGSSSPRQQIEKIGQLLKLRNLVITGMQPRPSQNGFDTAELIFSFSDATGRACQGWAWSAVNNSFGRNNTYTEIVWAIADVWRRDEQFLVATARLISVTNVQQAFQRDQLQRARVPTGPGSAGGFNHPNTFTPYSNQAAMNRISDQGARVRRDDYPLVDPSTGTTYHGSSDTYDYVRGGWVNPNDKTQLLKVVPPGQ
jgi:hypothetical protein